MTKAIEYGSKFVISNQSGLQGQICIRSKFYALLEIELISILHQLPYGL